MQENDEQELIARSLAGDHRAYADLVDRYKNAIYRHCYAVVRDEDSAEDIAQEVFIAAFYKLKLYDPQYRLSTWLFKIGTNRSLNYLKKWGKEVSVDDELIGIIISKQPTPHAEAVNNELRQAVANLNPKYRIAISLYYWQGLSIAETALAMGAPVGSVKVWLKRAKEDLRKELS
jgi:RNA polymerase sigma-70 factor, ECF subfamily